jgi:hypothetical protein
MSTNRTQSRTRRLSRVYDRHERAAIDVFKDQYMDATSPVARKTIAQVHIFPALFNYWISIGKDVPADEKPLRALVCLIFHFHLVCINIWIYKATYRLAPEYLAQKNKGPFD